MDKIIRLILLILILGAAVTVWDGFFILPEGKQAVITQFGAPVGNPVTKAGIKFKIPFIQLVHYFDKRVLICDGEPNQIPTIDKTFIYLDTTARWRIVDPLQFLQAVSTEK
ncbi:MAG: SPFH domain-containing protein, partial [Proteobacteria bacterium]|nr:SPFH domain-containing protein [Pseudomonadota bacterium]